MHDLQVDVVVLQVKQGATQSVQTKLIGVWFVAQVADQTPPERR